MLVIFDCDGVLVDTEDKSAEVFSMVLKKNGVNFSVEECISQFRGWTLSKCESWLRENKIMEFCDEQYPPDFIRQINQATIECFDAGVEAIPGVVELVALLKKRKIDFCVASNGGHEKMNKTLSSSGLIPFFNNKKFSAEDVAFGKPEPDLFLFAAKSMGYSADECVVVEDSMSGLKAAIAAGMRPIAYSPEQDKLLQFDKKVQLASSMKEVGQRLFG